MWRVQTRIRNRIKQSSRVMVMTLRGWLLAGALMGAVAGANAFEIPGVGVHYKLTPAQKAWTDSVAKRFEKCDIVGGALDQFPPYPYMPDPQDWFAMIELPETHQGDEVWRHTLVIHTVSNQAFVFTSGGPGPTVARGPIPLDFECTIVKGKRKAARQGKR